MINTHNLCYPFIILALCGTMTVSSLTLANDRSIASNRPKAVRVQSHRIKHALNKLGDQDDQEATVAYYRQGHLLIFSITNVNYQSKFNGKSLVEQARYFQKYTNIKHLKVIVQTTRGAEKRQAFQVREQKQQRDENHREAQQAKQEAIRQAKEQADKDKKKRQQQAKRKAEQKKRQQQKTQARKRELKEAEINAQKKIKAQKANKEAPQKQKQSQKLD